LAGAEVALGESEGQLKEAQEELDELAGALSGARREAAGDLAAAVRGRLGELAMEGAHFEAVLDPRERRGPGGDENVEFVIAPNPGVPAGPLREIASGGELSRVMLALMGVATDGAHAANGAGAGAGDGDGDGEAAFAASEQALADEPTPDLSPVAAVERAVAGAEAKRERRRQRRRSRPHGRAR
jgi:DNA repair protein RecN (Recombination protein N)